MFGVLYGSLFVIMTVRVFPAFPIEYRHYMWRSIRIVNRPIMHSVQYSVWYAVQESLYYSVLWAVRDSV